jgi:hypothetical protein
MESKKINQLATELAPVLSDLTIIGDPTTGISKKITLSQMASLFTGTVEEYPNLASFPLVGTADTIYIALDTNIIYRWNTGTSAYVELSPNVVSSLVFNDANGFDGTISLVGSVATLTITTALTQGSVPFIGSSGALTQDNANLFFDDTNNRLGINTNSPTGALDVFGSGIIGRLNGTSTNNAFLGFASAGTNKWSIGNVQSDHRFRIYNEATTSELVSVLQTGEFGIGIANPTTKFHIDGGASALIANLDANVSVAKSISFRSDNSARINLEVSGTESGSNAGANFFLRAYSDAGALLSTPLTITRSTGAATFANNIGLSASTGFPTVGLLNRSTDNNLYIVSASAGFTLTDSSLNTMYAATPTSHTWNISNSQRMILNSSGNLGINATPISRVHLQDTGGPSVVPTLTISQDGDLGLDWVAGALNFYSQDTSANSKGGIGHIRVAAEAAYNTGTTPSYMAFYTHPNIANNNTNLGAATEKMRITSGGEVQITGTGTLLLNGSTSNLIRSNGNSNLSLYAGTGTSPTGFIYFYAGNVERMNIANDGIITLSSVVYNNTTAGAANMYIGGTGILYRSTASSLRFKENINDWNENGLDTILALKPKTFTYKEDYYSCPNRQFLGLIAEEVAEVSSFLADFENEDGSGQVENVRYANIVVPLIKAIQELKAEVDILKAK